MSISIGSGSIFNTASTPIQNNMETSNLESTLSSNLSNATDEELMDVCKNFESYFIEQVFKEMKNTVLKADDENEYEEYFGDMLTEQYASEATANSGLGIAQMLYESMKRN